MIFSDFQLSKPLRRTSKIVSRADSIKSKCSWATTGLAWNCWKFDGKNQLIPLGHPYQRWLPPNWNARLWLHCQLASFLAYPKQGRVIPKMCSFTENWRSNLCRGLLQKVRDRRFSAITWKLGTISQNVKLICYQKKFFRTTWKLWISWKLNCKQLDSRTSK